jgi:hypothetical protein
MAGKRRVGKKSAKHASRKHRGTKIVPEHLMGKTLTTKHHGRKSVRRKKG